MHALNDRMVKDGRALDTFPLSVYITHHMMSAMKSNHVGTSGSAIAIALSTIAGIPTGATMESPSWQPPGASPTVEALCIHT